MDVEAARAAKSRRIGVVAVVAAVVQAVTSVMLFVDLTGQATGCPIYCGHLGLIGLVVVAVVFNVGWAATPIFAIWAIIRGGVARRVGIAALVAGLVPVVLLLVGLSTA